MQVNGWFEKSFMDDEGGLSLLGILDTDIIIAPSDVKLGEQFNVLEFIDEIRDKGKGVGVSNGMFVQVVVVLARTETTILLFDEEDWECLRGVQGVDLPTVKVFLEEILSGFMFFRGERVNPSNFGSEGVIKVDLVIIGFKWWDMIDSFFGEDQCKVGEFGGKGLFRFCFLGCCSNFGSSGDFGYLFLYRRSLVKKVRPASDDSMKGSVGVSTS